MDNLIANIIKGFANLIDPNIIFLLFSGGFLGVIIGALPGFTPTMGVALLIPFTFVMPPIYGLVLLGVIYATAVYGGSISAVLLNIPGAPANIATIFDGYPMAYKGEGEKALYLSLISSFFGGIIGALCLIFCAPPLTALALKFGPAENFWVAVFGLTIIASLGTTKELIKGLIGGCIGIILGVIGISPVTGQPRFTFGLSELIGGISLVPALIGLFAFTQVFVTFENYFKEKSHKDIQVVIKRHKGVFWHAWREVLKNRGLVLFSGLLGSVIGIVPGAGAQVAGIVAYDQAKRYSKNRDKFGKGIPEGIIAPEAANNGSVGGALVPLLTLGIPGSPTAAVLLGGILIHGLWPGPDLFIKHPEIPYSFMASVFAGQFILLICGYFLCRYAVNVLRTPPYILAPAIIVLCVFGSYAVQNNINDVYLMLILGILGYLGIKIGIQPAPVVLGLILGSIAENGLLLGVRIGEAKGLAITYFISRPLSLVLIFIVIASIVSTVLLEVRSRRLARHDAILAATEKPKGLKTLDACLGLIILVVSFLTWQFYSSKLPRDTGLWPSIILLVLILLGGILFVRGWRQESDLLLPIPWRFVLETGITSIILIVVGNILGFYTAAFLFMIYMPLRMLWLKRIKIEGKQIGAILTAGIIIIAIIYLAFGLFLMVPTPRRLLI